MACTSTREPERLVIKIQRVEGHCPVCREKIEDAPVVCFRCKTLHCLDCWQYNKRCAIYGCGSSAATAVKPDLNDYCCQCGSTDRIDCPSCNTPNCMECFGKLKLGCRGCEYLPVKGGKPSGSLMVITYEPPTKPWERIKKDFLMPLPVQMLETVKESLYPVNPVVARISAMILMTLLMPIIGIYLLNLLRLGSDLMFTYIFPALWPIGLLYLTKD
jgi:hypothetical protein